MQRWISVLDQFRKDTGGTTAVEYSLIAAVLALGILVGIRAVGVEVSATWGNVSNAVTNASGG